MCSQERVKDLETQIKDLKQLKQENAVLRAAIQQLTAQPTPSFYHIELRKKSIRKFSTNPTLIFFYLDGSGSKTVTTGSIYLSMYSNNDTLLSEQELKCNDELLYLMELNNITETLSYTLRNKSLTRP